MKYVIALAIALILNASANLLMKIGMKPIEQSGGVLRDGIVAGIKAVVTSGTLMLGLFCFGINAAFYMYALQSRALKISIAYPIMVGGGFALIAVFARVHPALAETLTRRQMLGIGLVLAGIILIASQADSGTA